MELISSSTYADQGGQFEYDDGGSMPSECGRGSVGSSAASLLCVSGHACSVRLSPSNGSCSGGTHRASHPCVSVCAFSGPLDSETSTDRTGIDAGA